MSSKTKYVLAVTLLIILAIILIVANIIVLLYSVIKIQTFDSMTTFEATEVNGFVTANYSYGDKTRYMTVDGTVDGETILNYNGELEKTNKQLKVLNEDDIVLTAKNDNIKFEYIFSNTNASNSFVIYADYFDTYTKDKNITISWGVSNNPIENFDDLENIFDFFKRPLQGLVIQTGKTYLYIQLKITDTNKNAELSGNFNFKMIG